MRTTFQAGTNTATNGTALGNAGEEVRVYKITIGTPVSAGNLTLYGITNPVNGATTNIAWKTTLPTFSTTNINPGMYQIDFGPEGLPIFDGGNFIMDQTMNVSIQWDLADNAKS